MYTAKLIVRLIKRARKLRRQWLTVRDIADKMKVDKNSVNKWINMPLTDENNIPLEQIEKRGSKPWALKKHSEEEVGRIINIYNQMIEEKRFFINKHTIKENYIHIHKEDIKENYIHYIMQKHSLKKRQQKLLEKWKSKYMNYPENTISKLWDIIEGIDFVWPRYIEWDNSPHHFLSRRYLRPDKHGKIDIIGAQTTQETITRLMEDWETLPIPDVLKIDNDSAFGMLKAPNSARYIWAFTKWLLYLWISPLYSVPRSPWNNGNVEWQNSVFNSLFWKEIFFENAEHLQIEITRFNTEYTEYSTLINTSKEDKEKRKIQYKYIADILKDKWITKDDCMNLDFIKKIDKKDLSCHKIYILRKVEREWDKWWESEKWTINVLWIWLELSKQYINSIVLVTLDIQANTIEIWQEQNWELFTIIKKPYVIKNL